MKPEIMKCSSQFRRSLAGTCSVLLMLCSSQSGFAQQSTLAKSVTAVAAVAATPVATSSTSKAAEQENETSAPRKPGSEGIKVHGHWVIDVKNPDGTVIEHRDFQNSLQDQGQLLTLLISGYVVTGGYGIVLVGNVCPPVGGGVNTTNCFLPQNPSAINALGECGMPYNCYGGMTLTVNYNSPTPPANSLVFSGTVTAPQAGTITAVQTAYQTCATSSGSSGNPNGLSAANPNTCLTAGGSDGGTVGTFTGTTLSPALNLTAGQILQVTVTISFS
jgi:hypothetical protein